MFFVARRFRAVGSVGRKECSVKCEVWRKQWEVWSVKCEVWSVKCEVWSVKFQFGVRRAQCEVWSVRFGVWREQWEVRSVKCEVWSVKFEVWSAKSAVWSVECEDFASSLAEKIKRLSREGHGRDRLSLNYRSFMFGKLPPPACPGLCYILWLVNVNINVNHWLIILWCVCGCFPVAGRCHFKKKCPGDAVADSNDLGAYQRGKWSYKAIFSIGHQVGWWKLATQNGQNADGLRLTMTMTKISNPWPNAHIESPRT